MWIVQNSLAVPLYFEDLEIVLPAGELFDLDALGRDEVLQSPQLQTALKSGYLREVNDSRDIGDSPVSKDTALSNNLEGKLNELRRAFDRGESLSQIFGKLREMEQSPEARAQGMSERIRSFRAMLEGMAGSGRDGRAARELKGLAVSALEELQSAAHNAVDSLDAQSLQSEIRQIRHLLEDMKLEFSRMGTELLQLMKRGVPAPGTGQGANTAGAEVSDVELRARMAMLLENKRDVSVHFNKLGRQEEGNGRAKDNAQLLSDL